LEQFFNLVTYLHFFTSSSVNYLNLLKKDPLA
jgi:hypothetical protein